MLTAFVRVGKVWCAGQTVITACCDALVPSSQRMWHSGALYGVQAAASIVLSSVLQSASSERTRRRHSTPFGSWTPHAGPSFEPVYNLRFETNRPVRKRSGVRYALRYGEKIESQCLQTWHEKALKRKSQGESWRKLAVEFNNLYPDDG